MQKRYGRDKLEVLPVSVDGGEGEMSPERYQSKSKTIFDKLDIDWPAVLDPDGWDGVMHKFNFTWFGLVVVDTEGVVRGIGVHGEQLSKLMQQIYPDHQ